METANRRVLLLCLALVLMCPILPLLPPAHTQTGDTPPLLRTAATPTNRLTSPAILTDDLAHRLTMNVTKKYLSFTLSPSARELEQIHNTVSLEDLSAIKLTTNRFFKMLVSGACDPENDAAKELAIRTNHHPGEEFISPPQIGGRAVKRKEGYRQCQSIAAREREGLIMVTQKPLATRILGTIKQEHGCDLNTLRKSLPDLSRSQIFLEVERLSQRGEVLVTFGTEKSFMIRLPDHKKTSPVPHARA